MPVNTHTSYHTKSAVLFLVFNRPDPTRQVFEQIRLSQPKRLYIAADAPRLNKPGEELLCSQVKEIVNNVDWECEVKRLYRKENAGCRDAVSAAVSWFFDNEEEGIILEDDCLPANSFFRFCDTLLEKYRLDTRVRHITGCNLQQGKKWGDGTYYFSNRTHVWGWAGWKRVWQDYDLTLKKYDSIEIKDKLLNIYDEPLIVESLIKIFNEVRDGKINSWAYPLDFANYFNNGLVIISNENLISNIGFGENATQTIAEDSPYANVSLSTVDEIKHPLCIIPEKQADMFILNNEFNVEERKRKEQALHRKVKKWVRSVFKYAAI